MSCLLSIPGQTALVKIGPVNGRGSLQNLQRERKGTGERTPRDGKISVARGEREGERRPRERERGERGRLSSSRVREERRRGRVLERGRKGEGEEISPSSCYARTRPGEQRGEEEKKRGRLFLLPLLATEFPSRERERGEERDGREKKSSSRDGNNFRREKEEKEENEGKEKEKKEFSSRRKCFRREREEKRARKS